MNRVLRFKLALAICALALASCATMAYATTTIFSDTFDSDTGWVFSGPTGGMSWNAADGVGVMNAGNWQGLGNAMRSDVSMPSTWTFDADIRWDLTNFVPDYGEGGLTLSDSPDSPNSSSNSAWVDFAQDSNGVRVAYSGGGVWMASDYTGVLHLGQPVTYHLQVVRPQGQDYLTATLTGGMSAITYQTPAVANIDQLSYIGLSGYLCQAEFDNVVITTTVPEPSSLIALAAGLVGVLGLRRGRKI